MPRQDAWDNDKHAFHETFVLQAEPKGPEESRNTRDYPRPALLDEYEAVVRGSLIFGLGDSW
jgi:hypothetical protein